MDVAFKLILPTHILAGSLCLLAGLVAMLAHKGGRTHRRAGKWYFWAMAYVGLSAVAMSLLRSGIFLLLIGIFSFYLAFTGYRALYHKTLPQRRGTWLDWSVAIIALLGGAALILLARLTPDLFPEHFLLVAQIFGAFGTVYAASDLYGFLRPNAKPMRWWFLHMQRMLASYVAALTAFSAVNFQFLPTNIRWLWPTALGLAGGTIWARYYKRKFATAAARRAGTSDPKPEKRTQAPSPT